MSDDELTFAKAVQKAVETEDAFKTAKETVQGSKPMPILKMNQKKAPIGQKETGKFLYPREHARGVVRQITSQRIARSSTLHVDSASRKATLKQST